jgi:hypothetical protein
VAILVSTVYFVYLPFALYNNYFNKWFEQGYMAREEFFTEYIYLGHYLEDFDKGDYYVVSNWWQNGQAGIDEYKLQTTDYILRMPNREYNVRYYDSIKSSEPGYYFIPLYDQATIDHLPEIFESVEVHDYIVDDVVDENIYGVYKAE